MDIGKEFATDNQLELAGVWVDLDDKTRVRVARMNNKPYRAALRRVLKPFKTQISAGTLPVGRLDDLLVGPLAAHILLDWEQLEMNGALLEYSKENAERLLNDYPDFRELITTLASDMELFRVAEQEADAKN